MKQQINVRDTRDNLIDTIKAFAIILVVLGHSIQYNMPQNFDSSYLFRLIYSFHMPLFMFLSGYVSLYSSKPSLKTIAKKAKALLLPYLSWIFINYSIFHNDMSFYEYQKMVVNFPDNALWFLYILFFCHVGLYILSKIPTNYSTLIGTLISIPIMFLPYYLFGFNLFKWYFFFFIIGRLVNENKNRLKLNNSLILSIVVPLFFFLSLFWQRNTPPQISFIEPVSAFIFKISVPCLGIISTFSIFKALHLHSAFWSKTIGMRTLEIYITHFLFLFPCIYFLNGHVNTWLAILITCIFCLSCSLLLAYIIEKNKTLSLVLFGK